MMAATLFRIVRTTMAGEISTIQSLKAVDAWIDVINANINGGVRTAFKSSRLKFAGSNVEVSRTGNATSLPLQFPESGLTTANTVIDFGQGAVTASTEHTNLAIQGEGFFLLASPDLIETNPATSNFGTTKAGVSAKFLLTRDGEFRADQNGFLRHVGTGYYLVTSHFNAASGKLQLNYSAGGPSGLGTCIRAVYDNIGNASPPAVGCFVRLSEYTENASAFAVASGLFDNEGNQMIWSSSLVKVNGGKQNLKYSTFGSTVWDFGYNPAIASGVPGQFDQNVTITAGITSDATILTKSLEASNASMTQSVPELSLAQKLFSALTKVLQTKQTNVDGVLNLVR
jgi:flagellar hook protein FlgE